MRRLLSVVVLSTNVCVAAAQATNSPRAIPLPDTLGAGFSIADSATRSGTPADFDFLIGLWEFRFQTRRPDGTFQPSWSGHWLVTRKQGSNPFVEDHFRADDPRSPYDVGTWTYRVFNPGRKIWEMQGVDSRSGAWSPGLCWSDGTDNRFLVQRYGPNLMRIRYLAITDTSFLWRADRSADNGKSWTNDWWTMSARRLTR